MENKIIILARKLKALCERGIGGEKENADKMLSELLVKHGLTMADIEEDKKEMRTFDVTLKDQEIFVIVAANVIGFGEASTKLLHRPDMPDKMMIELSNAQFIELEAKYDFFKRAYHEEWVIWFSAFVVKQGLQALDAKKSDDDPDEARDFRIWLASQNIKKRQFRSQIKW